MTIVDTTVWIDYFRGLSTEQTTWLDKHLSQQRIGVTDLILCEVLQGIRHESRVEAVQQELFKLEIFSTGGVDLALAAAANYRKLRTKDFTIRRTLDCFIATFCLQHDHALLHHDRDFDPFEKILGLRVIHP
jgi:predicted nucleic acid-binding protein